MRALKAPLVVVGLAAALCGSPSYGVDITDTLMAGESFTFTQTAAAFSDSLAFTIGEPLDFTLSFTNLQMGSRATVSVFLNGNEIVGTFGRNVTWSWGPFGTLPAFPVGTEFLVTVAGTDGTPANASYSLTLSAVPEPSTLAMLGLGALAVVSGVWRNRRV